MTQPIAGWYTDPAGDATKLRYWDGSKWTNDLMDAPAPQAPGSAEPQPAPTSAPTPAPASAPQPAQSAQPATQPAQPGGAYEAAYQQPTEQPIYADATAAPIYVGYADAPLYYVSPQDSTLRLVAFILALISTIALGFAVIPLAWMIPMTVRTWKIYKGKSPNTVAFGVCSLIFLDIVGGVLLLISTKDE